MNLNHNDNQNDNLHYVNKKCSLRQAAPESLFTNNQKNLEGENKLKNKLSSDETASLLINEAHPSPQASFLDKQLSRSKNETPKFLAKIADLDKYDIVELIEKMLYSSWCFFKKAYALVKIIERANGKKDNIEMLGLMPLKYLGREIDHAKDIYDDHGGKLEATELGADFTPKNKYDPFTDQLLNDANLQNYNSNTEKLKALLKHLSLSLEISSSSFFFSTKHPSIINLFKSSLLDNKPTIIEKKSRSFVKKWVSVIYKHLDKLPKTNNFLLSPKDIKSYCSTKVKKFNRFINTERIIQEKIKNEKDIFENKKVDRDTVDNEGAINIINYINSMLKKQGKASSIIKDLNRNWTITFEINGVRITLDNKNPDGSNKNEAEIAADIDKKRNLIDPSSDNEIKEGEKITNEEINEMILDKRYSATLMNSTQAACAHLFMYFTAPEYAVGMKNLQEYANAKQIVTDYYSTANRNYVDMSKTADPNIYLNKIPGSDIYCANFEKDGIVYPLGEDFIAKNIIFTFTTDITFFITSEFKIQYYVTVSSAKHKPFSISYQEDLTVS